MREIKFRAWDTKEKQMSEVFSLADHFGDGDMGAYWPLPGDGPRSLENERDVIMQYTGLKDKNGKEIYEGDIIARYWSDGSILQQFTVKWFDDKAGYAINPTLLSSTRHNQQTGMTGHGFKVIGNIYANPELVQ